MLRKIDCKVTWLNSPSVIKTRQRLPRSVTIHVVIRPKPGGLKPKPKGPVQDASAEFSVHSFIVKVWLEEEATEDSDSVWHGQITHVPSGEKRYLNNLDQISLFIRPYLEAMGIRFGLSERIRKCLSFRRNPPDEQRKKHRKEE